MAQLPATPLRPLGVAEILDGAVWLVRRNARAALSIAVPLAVLRTAIGALLQYATIDSENATTGAAIVELVLLVAFGVVVTGLLTPLFAADLLGERRSAGQTMRLVRGSAWALGALSVLVMLAEAIGIAALVVGGVWLWGVWAVAAPALVQERLGPGAALRRSVELVRTLFWRTWGIRALGWVLTTVLGLLIVLPFDLLAAYLSDANPFDSSAAVTHPGWFVTILAIGAVISASLLSPVSAAIDVLLYTDLRMRKEGLDIVLAMGPDGDASPAQPQQPVAAW